jgi:hypothetical protein
MTTLNSFDRQCLADMLCREGIAAILSELAWLQVEGDLTRLLARSSGSQLTSLTSLAPLATEDR